MMEPKEPDAAGGNPSCAEPPKVPLAPRKAAMFPPGENIPETGLHLTPTSNEPAWARRNRICPKSPKVPFGHQKNPESPSGTPAPADQTRRGSNRGLIAFFRNRQLGRSRILNFIFLPIAVLLAFAAILVLFKFH